MDEKKWYKSIWLWIIAAFLLCIINILFACIWRTEASNIFTAISGWVSGIATAILGSIALWQNKKYKEDGKTSDAERKTEIDEHNKNLLILQTELKKLTEKVAKSTKSLEKIEEIKYYPCLQEVDSHYVNLTYEKYREILEDERIIICNVYYNIERPFDEKDFEKLFREYHAMSFGLKNIGEIR